MRLPPRFWAAHEASVPTPERAMRIRMWGWSDESDAAAAQHARSRVDAVAGRGGPGRREWDAYYPVAPVREPVLGAFDETGSSVPPSTPARELRAFVTRTGYGAVVLNSDAVVIVDIDLPDPVAAGGLRSALRAPVHGAAVVPSAAHAEAVAHRHARGT